ncbi:terpene synthase family protein [Streptomyces sp. NPDC018045]|uniref:terpene synthase family protein n=1 Tax=Streptomyces sp. NPDC018045 TaxID=3365037 RepID=UPI00378D7E42
MPCRDHRGRGGKRSSRTRRRLAGKHASDAHRHAARTRRGPDGGRRGAAPRLTDYLRYGAWSIGVEQQVTALWVLLDEPDLPGRLPVLRGALRQAATAIRLLNDLRGHRREQTEGKADVLAVGLTEREAYERAEAGLASCRRVLAPLSTAGYGSAVALERVVLSHARMYHRFDPYGPAGRPPLPCRAAPPALRTPPSRGRPRPWAPSRKSWTPSRPETRTTPRRSRASSTGWNRSTPLS